MSSARDTTLEIDVFSFFLLQFKPTEFHPTCWDDKRLSRKFLFRKIVSRKNCRFNMAPFRALFVCPLVRANH